MIVISVHPVLLLVRIRVVRVCAVAVIHRIAAIQPWRRQYQSIPAKRLSRSHPPKMEVKERKGRQVRQHQAGVCPVIYS